MKKQKMLSMFMVLAMVCTLLSTSLPAAAIDFNGTQRSTYNLSNGKTVRIEYHGGKPHYHELEKGVDKGSENLNDNEAHHSDGKKPSKSTRDIVKGDKQKSQADKNAKKKADSLKKEWEKAEENAKNSSKNFIEKNIDAIKDAVNAGGAVVVIGGVAYALWWILKIASGFGILIPV